MFINLLHTYKKYFGKLCKPFIHSTMKAWLRLSSRLLLVREYCLNRTVFTSKSGNDKLNPCFFYFFRSFNGFYSEVLSQNVSPRGTLCTKLTTECHIWNFFFSFTFFFDAWQVVENILRLSVFSANQKSKEEFPFRNYCRQRVQDSACDWSSSTSFAWLICSS